MQASDPLDPRDALRDEGTARTKVLRDMRSKRWRNPINSFQPRSTRGQDKLEDRSSERVRTLVTQWPDRGLSANENARALISMMPRSTTRSNQRPHTLMQDRHRQLDEILQRTAGPYIGSIPDRLATAHMLFNYLASLDGLTPSSWRSKICPK
jgi:hypothetical protein